MATATTTCAYYNPVRADGSPVGTPGVDTFQFASSTCVSVSDIATSSISTTTVSVSFDSGDVVFGLALILFLMGIMVMGLIFPISKKH